MIVTALIENRPSRIDPSLEAEWGLSLHVEVDGHRILFDAGASGAFADNAERLSVDVASVESAVLSHHHYDHGGGLRRFLGINFAAKVYMAEGPRGECFLKVAGPLRKYVGLDRALAVDFADRIETVGTPRQIASGIHVFPRIAGVHPRPRGNRHLYVRTDGAFVPDDFAHELVMAIREKDGLVVFTGCSHSGVLNAIDTVAREFEGVPIKAVIGGFHLAAVLPWLVAGGEGEAESLGRALLDYPIEKAYAGHCTGKKAFGILQEVMGERIVDLRTGDRFEV